MRAFFQKLLILSSVLCALPATSAQTPVSPIELVHQKLFATYPTPTTHSDAEQKLVQRGEYLAKVGDCISCHTDTPSGGTAFAGGLPIKTPFGTFYSPNITPDKETGIGSWTDESFIRAMRDGKDPKGHNYFPVFPYIYFNKVSDQDLLAIKAYLMRIPAVKKANKPHAVSFPFNVRFLQYGWKLLFFDFHRGQFKYDPTKSPEWNRGAYLVEGLGHCGMCHTPLNFLGGPERGQYLSGGFVDGFWAPDITQLGLQGVTVSDVVDVFADEDLLRSAGKVAGPMAEVNHNSLRYLTEDDLKSIAIYLQNVKSHRKNLSKELEGARESVVAKAVFQQRCASCHGAGQGEKQGAPLIGDTPNWTERLKKGMPTLYEHTVKGFNQMPVKGNCLTCSDADIRIAVDYLVANSVPKSLQERLFVEPPKPLTAADGKAVYAKSCASCHDTGKNGAPKLGDKQAWTPRVAKHMDVLFEHAIRGIDGRHVKGGCTTCSNAEVIAATKYMVQQSKVEGDYSLW